MNGDTVREQKVGDGAGLILDYGRARLRRRGRYLHQKVRVGQNIRLAYRIKIGIPEIRTGCGTVALSRRRRGVRSRAPRGA